MNKLGNDLDLAASILLNGGVIAFPTETVMGLGVVFDNEDSYKKLNHIKGRPEFKPYSMMIKDVKEIEKYAYISEKARKIIAKFLPGPLTILLKAKDNVPSYVTHDTGIIGIRVPQHDILNKLLNKVDKPLLVPSANPSGMEPATTSEQVTIYFGELLDYIIENNSNCEPPSTIVDLTNNDAQIIREGSITKEEIFDEIKEY